MIKDKNGNRVNFIKRDIKNPLTGAILYDYVDQIKGPGNSNVWACPYCICLPCVPSNLTDCITCTVTSQSEPVPQRASTTSLIAGDYIYCNEEIRMDCTDATLKSMYLSRLRFNFYNSDWTMQPILPKTFKFKRNDGIHQGISTVLNNNSSIVEDGSGNVIEMALTPQDYFGSFDFRDSNGNYIRPAFSGSGSSYNLSYTFSPMNGSSTYNRIKELYNNGTFELLDNDGNKKTGTVQVSVIQTGSTSFMCEVKLISTTAIPRKVGTASSTRVILIPRANFQNLYLACVPTTSVFKAYGVGSSIFGEEDCYIERERIETSDGLTNKYNLYICGTNKRLYTFDIEAKSISWLTRTGDQTDVTTMTLNQQGGSTYPGENYRILIHQATQDTALENEFMTLKVDGKHVLGINFNYTFTFDSDYNFFGVQNMVLNISDKILDTIKKVS